MKFACPHCQSPLEADDSFAGAAVDCPTCGKSLVIPATSPAEPPQPAAQPEQTPPPPPTTKPATEQALPASEPVQEAPAPQEPAADATPPPSPPAPKAAPKFRVVSKPKPSAPVSSPSKMAAAPQITGPRKRVECPHCFAAFEAAESAMGTYVDCPSCGKRFRAQPAQPTGRTTATGTAGTERLSMTLPLVFQSIVLGGIALTTLFCFSHASDAMMFMVWVFPILAILNIVFTTMFHYKCWNAMPSGFARLTPGKAAGYLFIPCFSLYWAFPSIGGLGADCAAYAKSKGVRGFNHLRGLGLTLAILMCVVGAIWVFMSLTSASSILNDIAYDDFSFGPLVLMWAIGGGPVVGLLLGIARFVIWLLFYRSVTRLLNRVVAEESGATPAG